MNWTDFPEDGLSMRDHSDGCAMVGTDTLNTFGYQAVIIFGNYEMVVHGCSSVKDAQQFADRLIGLLVEN